MKNGKYSLSGYITRLAILLALVIVLQIFGSYIRIGTVNLSLVLIPVVLGGMLLGPLAGTVFGTPVLDGGDMPRKGNRGRIFPRDYL